MELLSVVVESWENLGFIAYSSLPKRARGTRQAVLAGRKIISLDFAPTLVAGWYRGLRGGDDSE